MYSFMPLGTTGMGPGQCAWRTRRAPSMRGHQVSRQGGQLPSGPGRVLPISYGVRQNFQEAFGKLGRRQPDEEDDTAEDAGWGSVFRNVFDFSTSKTPPSTTASAAYTTATAASVGLAGRASAAAVEGPSAAAAEQATSFAASTTGSLTAGQNVIASVAVASSSPAMDTLAQQVLTGHTAAQDDPVAAARQLQMFLAQYRDQYGPETDSRISAAVAKLQDYINGYQGQGVGADAAAAAAAAAAATAGGAVDGTGGDGVVYHNYILEQLTGVLDWINNLLVNSNPKPYVFDAYGRIMEDPNAVATVEQQQEQLRAASSSLRLLIQQLQQVNRQYAAMSDPDEKAAMGQVLSQLTTMADRLAVAATRRPLVPPAPGVGAAAADAAASAAAAAGDISPFMRPDQVYGAEKYRDPLLKVLDGIYHAVVVDSGLREFLSGIKQLGDSLVASMSVAWTGAPPIGRLIAYIAAVAGVVFVMRTRLPKSLLDPTTKFLGQLGIGGSTTNDNNNNTIGGAGSSGTAPPSLPPGAAAPPPANPSAAAAFAAIAANSSGTSDGPATASAAAAAFAAIAANSSAGVGSGVAGGSGANPLADLDRDWGIGDTRLPSEILASNDPYAARQALVDAQATPVALASSGGQLASTSGTAAFPSQPYSAAIPKPPPGGWSGQFSDRVDWWSLGQQKQPSQQQPSQQPPPPPPPQQAPGDFDPARPRTVAESWEAFRRINDTAPAPTGGVLDTTAALAAAAVAAAAGASGGDPKMAELARATEERRLDKDRARLRATIKDRLRWVCLALGPVSSVVPGGEPLREEVDGLLAQLEALTPTDKPLNTVVDVARRPTVVPPIPLVDSRLLGDWRLVYASNASSLSGAPSAASQAAGGGPNLLAQLLHIADSLPGFGMTQVVQRLTLEDDAPPGPGSLGTPSNRFSNTGVTSATGSRPPGSGFSSGGGPSGPASRTRSANISTENSAVFRFGPLGSWRVSVRGRWIDNGGGLCASAEFESFAVRPVELWGLPVEQLLPEVVVPVPEVLRSRTEWCTTYLDDDMRIGRGSGGALFLFKRGAVDRDAVGAAPLTGMPPQQPRVPVAPGAAAATVSQPQPQQPQPVMRPL